MKERGMSSSKVLRLTLYVWVLLIWRGRAGIPTSWCSIKLQNAESPKVGYVLMWAISLSLRSWKERGLRYLGDMAEMWGHLYTRWRHLYTSNGREVKLCLPDCQSDVGEPHEVVLSIFYVTLYKPMSCHIYQIFRFINDSFTCKVLGPSDRWLYKQQL